MKSKPLYARVVLPLPPDRYFDYSVPETFKGKVAVGQRVRVPFGNKRKIGYIVGLESRTNLPLKSIKPIENLVDEAPLLDPTLLELSKRMKAYYLCSWGEALEAILPSSLRPRTRGNPPEQEPLKELESLSVPDAVQKKILDDVKAAFESKTPKTFLLLGNRSEGKTELLLQIVHEILKKELSALVLYPEIEMAKAAFERFKRFFGKEVCIFHGALSPLDRYALWNDLREGRVRIVVGSRSAVFSPVKRLGLVILCEEHDPGYKQDESPRYHARQIAFFRSSLEGASVLLESDTPSFESYTEALKGRAVLLDLTGGQPPSKIPKVHVVDMREEWREKRRKVFFSKYLERRMANVLEEKGQILLFLNRRGFSTYIHCRKCGQVRRCPSCQLPLKYHAALKRLRCHTCNTEELPQNVCPECRGSVLRYTGVGTERIESEAHRLFPAAQIARLDTDALREGSRDQMTEAFRKKELDILIGTQMVVRQETAVPLVGILSADTLLNTPDFRASERAFSLLSRLVGQAARDEKKGEVIIQSFSPNHPAILAASTQNYQAFYEVESRFRKELGFPPFRFLARILFRGKKEESVSAASRAFKKRLARAKKGRKISLLGPAPDFLHPVKGECQWQLLVKSQKSDLADFLKKPLERFERKGGVRVIVDIDPY